MIDTAHSLGVKVAVHASTPEAVIKVADLGVESVEHGTAIDDEAIFERMSKNNVVWNPTLSVCYTRSYAWEQAMNTVSSTVTVIYRLSLIRNSCPLVQARSQDWG